MLYGMLQHTYDKVCWNAIMSEWNCGSLTQNTFVFPQNKSVNTAKSLWGDTKVLFCMGIHKRGKCEVAP